MKRKNPFDKLTEEEKHDATHFIQQRLLRESKVATSYESARFIARQLSVDSTDMIYRASLPMIKKTLKEYKTLTGF